MYPILVNRDATACLQMDEEVQTMHSRLTLEKLGRDSNFAYVCDSYKPHLRLDPKYQQWRRLLNRSQLREMTPNEKHCLHNLLALKIQRLKNDKP